MSTRCVTRHAYNAGAAWALRGCGAGVTRAYTGAAHALRGGIAGATRGQGGRTRRGRTATELGRAVLRAAAADEQGQEDAKAAAVASGEGYEADTALLRFELESWLRHSAQLRVPVALLALAEASADRAG